jgi:hypothetical protein
MEARGSWRGFAFRIRFRIQLLDVTRIRHHPEPLCLFKKHILNALTNEKRKLFSRKFSNKVVQAHPVRGIKLLCKLCIIFKL